MRIENCYRCEALFSFGDDATVVGAGFALQPCMAEKTIEERLSALEAQLENKGFGEHFREQAETDRLTYFVYRFEGLDKKLETKLDARLSSLENRLDARLAERLASRSNHASMFESRPRSNPSKQTSRSSSMQWECF